MPGTVRLYFDAAVALAIMVTFAAIAGLLVAGTTGDRTAAFLAAFAVFALTGAGLTVRLWRLMRKPVLLPEPAIP